MRIQVNVTRQMLTLTDSTGRIRMQTQISTARKGVGEAYGSERTPRGRHIIRAKIGVGIPLNGVFIGRRFSREIYSPALRALHPQRDWILTRILWLSGCEIGRNRLGTVDTMRRYIYIHGCPDDDAMGVPGSRGCVKMRNDEIVRLFDLVDAGSPVDILTEE
ncbi:MAG: L,D-transpeptidase family protein [Acidiferrobacteraceae bacterium]